MGRERETKVSVHGGYVLPDLTDGPAGISAEVCPALALRATYYDAEDLRLARSGITLRHRAGEGAARWTLKLPVADTGEGLDRDELEVAGSDGRPPTELLDFLTARLRGEPLVPVAVLRTRRIPVLLRDPAGAVRAEVVDDTVSLVEGRRVLTRFREVEVEQHDNGAEVAAAAVACLVAAGAVVGEQQPKLVRILGPRATAPSDLPTAPRVRPEDPASLAVRAALATGLTRLVSNDPGVRRFAPDAVHQLRVACRRLRSDLRTFAPLFDDSRLPQLREELAWLADELGQVRDLEVLRARLAKTAAAEPLAPLDPAGVAAVDAVLAEAEDRARPAVLAALRSPRYVELVNLLVATATDPGLAEAAQERCSIALPPLLEASWDHLARRTKRLDPGGADDAWHRARILAKRTRYAAEAVAPILGGRARRTAKAATAVQEILGEHQDAAIAAERVLEVSGERPDDMVLAVTCARLAERERAAVRRARAQHVRTWKSVKKR